MSLNDIGRLRDSLSTAVRLAAETGASTPEIIAKFRRENPDLIRIVTPTLISMALTRLVSDVAKRRGRKKKRDLPGQVDMFGARLGELLTVPKSADGSGRATDWRRFGSLRHTFAKKVVDDHLELKRRQDKFSDFSEILKLSEPFATPDMSVDQAYALYLESAGGASGAASKKA
jgi:hypothetical protein